MVQGQEGCVANGSNSYIATQGVKYIGSLLSMLTSRIGRAVQEAYSTQHTWDVFSPEASHFLFGLQPPGLLPFGSTVKMNARTVATPLQAKNSTPGFSTSRK